MRLPLASVRFGLHNQIGGALAQVQSVPVGVERTAGFLVQNHQRVEPVDVELGEAFRSAHHGNVHASLFDEVCA